MADNNDKSTIFQRLQRMFTGSPTFGVPSASPAKTVYNIRHGGNQVIDTASSPEEREFKIKQLKQQRLLAKQWRKTQNDINNASLNSLNEIRFMYRDCDLMDGFPEIGTGLDIYADECCYINDMGKMVNVEAPSRIKKVLEDLFENRLGINVSLPMVVRNTVKYGNTFMFLNLSKDNGVMGWKQMPTYEMERYEDGMTCAHMIPWFSSRSLANTDETLVGDTTFLWVGQTEYIPYRNWQMAHFRLLYDSQFLPYGVSMLHKARRHFRMLSMMEDMMLIYRLDRSVERRVFKVNVGNIDEADVPAFMDEIADRFKRTPIIDPMTGQVDTRKNLLDVASDFFIPVRDDGAPNPIETLPAGQNLTAMDDIKYIQNKIVTALRIPKPFLNFEETAGEGKNLSLLDVRFMRTVNRIQQSILMELNKIAVIHLYLLGFEDDMTNFTLTMNNPSSQAELMELELFGKKVQIARDAVSDAGFGMPLTSMSWVWKHIFKWSDEQIKQNLEEMRLEAALIAELKATNQIIKRTHIYDPVDNLYGEPGAEYSAPEEGGEDGGGGPGGGGGGGFMGGDFDFGDGGGDMETGEEGEMPIGDAMAEEGGVDVPTPDNGGGEQVDNGNTSPDENMPNVGEAFMNRMKKGGLLTETPKRAQSRKVSVGKPSNPQSAIKQLMETVQKHTPKKQPTDLAECVKSMIDSAQEATDSLDSIITDINKYTIKE